VFFGTDVLFIVLRAEECIGLGCGVFGVVTLVGTDLVTGGLVYFGCGILVGATVTGLNFCVTIGAALSMSRFLSIVAIPTEAVIVLVLDCVVLLGP